MPLNQASRKSGLVSVAAALECVRRHIAAGNLPPEPPYTDPALFEFCSPIASRKPLCGMCWRMRSAPAAWGCARRRA